MSWLVPIAWVLGASLAVWLLVTVLYLAVTVPQLARNFADSPWLLFASPAAPVAMGEEVTLRTSDDRGLRGTLLRAAPERFRGGVVLCHELTGSRWNLAELGQRLQQSGFDVLLFDFCNHGDSDRVENYRPLPWVTEFEVRDVEAALGYLEERLPADAGLWLYGVSKGANAGIVAASRRKRLALVVADGTFPTMPIVEHDFRRFIVCKSRFSFLWSRMPAFCLRRYFQLAIFFAGRSCGNRFLSLMRALPNVEQPVLLIRGARDRFVTDEVTAVIRRRLAGDAEVWRAPNAKHNGGFAANPELYYSQLMEFVDAQLHSDQVDRTGGASALSRS